MVKTGLDTETILFNSLRDVPVPMRCSPCGKIHKWSRKNSWVEVNGRDGKANTETTGNGETAAESERVPTRVR